MMVRRAYRLLLISTFVTCLQNQVAAALIASFLPKRREQLQNAGVELIWLATDFFLTLAAKVLTSICPVWGPRFDFSSNRRLIIS